LLALLVGGGLVALLKSGTREAQSTEPSTTKPTVVPSISSASQKPASTPVPEKTEWTVVVPANVKWLDTGIQVTRGTRLSFHATGTVTWGPAGITDGTNVVGPNGTRPPFPQDADPFPMPKAGIGSLVMRIGGVKYAIGADDVVQASASGNIQLMVNDDAVGDNSGSFTVRISKE
jgi:hypothetical protein